jgi:hypothetical protein
LIKRYNMRREYEVHTGDGVLDRKIPLHLNCARGYTEASRGVGVDI